MSKDKEIIAELTNIVVLNCIPVFKLRSMSSPSQCRCGNFSYEKNYFEIAFYRNVPYFLSQHLKETWRRVF